MWCCTVSLARSGHLAIIAAESLGDNASLVILFDERCMTVPLWGPKVAGRGGLT